MYFQLKDIELNLHLGVPEEERIKKQKILISIFFEIDTKKAELSDNVKDTVHYQIIYDLIQEFSKISENNPYKLLEKLHFDLLAKMKNHKDLTSVKNLNLEIQKFPFSSGSIRILN